MQPKPIQENNMSCFSVYITGNNKHIRTFSYNFLVPGDIKRAEDLAFRLAWAMHRRNYPCTVERFHMISRGVQVLSTAHAKDPEVTTL